MTDNSKRNFIREYFDLNFINFLRGIELGTFDLFEKDCYDFLDFSGKYYCCCILQMKCIVDLKEPLREAIIRAEKTEGEIREKIGHEFNLYRIKLGNSVFVYIINLNNKADKNKLTEIFRFFEINSEDIELRIGIGRIREHINNIWKSYSDAMTAIDNRKTGISYQIIDSDYMDISYTIIYTFEQEKKILNYLKTKDCINIKRTLIEIIEENRKVCLSHKHMNILFMQLFNTAIRYAAENGLDMKKVSTETEQEFFNTDNTDIYSYNLKLICLIDFYFRVMEITGKEREKQNSVMVENIINYVKNNYCNGLYIENVASHIDLSSKYISKIFKQKMNISLVDYISSLQIEKSKVLLLETNKTIDEIASCVGINSRITFYRLFKKHEGVSPSSFRKAGA